MLDDRWPLPHFNPGDPKHLHAIGVIATTFVQFENGVERLFLHHPANSSVPFDLLAKYFFTLSEDQRIATTRKFYVDQEHEQFVRAAAHNVLDFFQWAHDCRNKILHSERYPASFGADPAILYLTKRASKRDHSPRYMALDLKTLRSTAEQMRKGIVRAAEIGIYMRYRGVDPSTIEQSIRAYVTSPDFPTMIIPPRIELTETPNRLQGAP